MTERRPGGVRERLTEPDDGTDRPGIGAVVTWYRTSGPPVPLIGGRHDPRDDDPRDYPLVAPAAIPSMMNRWAQRNSRISGRTTKHVPAMTTP